MLVPRIQSTNLPKSMIKRTAPKVTEAAQKLGRVFLTEAKVAMPEVEKAIAIRMYGSGGSVCSDSYSVEAPDLYSC